MNLRKSNERGHFDFGWLDTYHTFSFGEYFDRRYMGFGALRVINEDRISPSAGFPTHPHRDMEIVTYLLEGSLEHKDSMGNGSVIIPGQIQRMSAGTGVTHSEFNPSDTQPTHLFQIWIQPDRAGHQPGYEQIDISPDLVTGRFGQIAGPDGAEGSVLIHQDARIKLGCFDAGEKIEIAPDAGRKAWIHLARGEARIESEALQAGDAVALEAGERTVITPNAPVEILWFDVA